MDAKKRELMLRLREREVMEKFAKELIRQFAKNMEKTELGQTGALEKSFRHRLYYDHDRRVNKLAISHLAYGTFVDMGVSNGVELDDIGIQKIGKSLLGKKIGERRAKRWYYKKIYGQTIRLAEYVMNERGLEFRVAIEDAFDEVSQIKLHI